MSNRQQSTQRGNNRKWTTFGSFSEAAAFLHLQQTEDAVNDADLATKNGVHKASINGSPPVEVLQEVPESEAVMLDTTSQEPEVHNEANGTSPENLTLGPVPAE